MKNSVNKKQAVVLKLKHNSPNSSDVPSIHHVADPQMLFHRMLRLHNSENKSKNQKVRYDASDWRNIKTYKVAPEKNQIRNLENEASDDANESAAHIDIIAISNCHLTLWSTEVGIGGPKPQTFSVALDTSSTALWVPSRYCDDSCSDKPWLNYYDERKSKTFVPNPRAKRDEFMVDHVRGVFAVDQIQVGDIIAPEQPFATVTSMDPHSGTSHMCENVDGVFGLNVHTKGSGKPYSPIYGLLDNVPFPMFSLYLSPHDDFLHHKVEKGSEWILGGVDQRHYEGCIHWHTSGHNHGDQKEDEENTGHWDFMLDLIAVGDEKIQEGPVLGILDSSSFNIVGPKDRVSAFAVLNGMQCYVLNELGEVGDEVSCEKDDFDLMMVECDPKDESRSWEPLRFVGDGGQAVYEFNLFELSDIVQEGRSTFCRPRIAVSDVIPMWVLGAPFLMKYYSVYDVNKMSVGLALAADQSDKVCEDDIPISVATQQWIGDDQFNENGGEVEEKNGDMIGDGDDNNMREGDDNNMREGDENNMGEGDDNNMREGEDNEKTDDNDQNEGDLDSPPESESTLDTIDDGNMEEIVGEIQDIIEEEKENLGLDDTSGDRPPKGEPFEPMGQPQGLDPNIDQRVDTFDLGDPTMEHPYDTSLGEFGQLSGPGDDSSGGIGVTSMFWFSVIAVAMYFIRKRRRDMRDHQFVEYELNRMTNDTDMDIELFRIDD